MDIFQALALIGGLAMFLFGMEVMGDALKQRAGGQLKHILERLTANPLKGFSLGLIVTAIIQSSSATTVMVVGFVNSGIMALRQGISVIIGANVGTTATAWILSLAGIQGEGFWLRLLKPSSFTPILALIGIGLHLFAKSSRKKTNGTILLGFAVLMYGMEAMSNAVSGLAESPEFTQILTLFSNPFLGLLAGLVLTAIIQSSSASIGILQAISLTGVVPFSSAIPILMGMDIGTCVTALLSSIGAKKEAKRAAIVHLYFNIIGSAIFLTLFYSLNAIFHFPFFLETATPAGIAIINTFFKLFSSALMLPFTGFLEHLARLTIRDSDKEEEFQLLEDRFLTTPSFAVAQCRIVTNAMAHLARETLFKAMGLTHEYHNSTAQEVLAMEDKIDVYEDKIGTYLIKLSSQPLSMKDSREVSRLLHCIGDFERISDHAVNLMQAAEEMHDKKISFSQEAKEGLSVMYTAVKEITNLAIDAFTSHDLKLASMVEPLEQVVDLLKASSKHNILSDFKKAPALPNWGLYFLTFLPITNV